MISKFLRGIFYVFAKHKALKKDIGHKNENIM